MWPSALALMVASLLGRFPRHVSFTHRSTAAHLVDLFVRTWQVRHSRLRLADSNKSAEWVNHRIHAKVTVLPPIFETSAAAGPRILNPGAILKMFKFLHQVDPAVTLDFYGPDGGDLDDLLAQIGKLRLDSAVRYKGVLPPVSVQEKVRAYDYIVLLSHTEGMALAVVEAMQAGVVPVVGAVGGPGEYCQDGINAIRVENYSDEELQRAAATLARISSEPENYRALSLNASETFRKAPLFEPAFNRVLSSTFAEG
jgi:glycosyltransferase involved in cell wall biosynthesis